MEIEIPKLDIFQKALFYTLASFTKLELDPVLNGVGQYL